MALLFIFDNVVKPLIGYAIDPIKRHVSYPFQYKSNVENLDDKVHKLNAARDRVQHCVDEEKMRNGKLIEKEVEKWLEKVKGITERLEAERTERDERAKKRCLGIGFCPNLKDRYQLSRKAEKDASAVAIVLQEEREFGAKISYPTAPQVTFEGGYQPLQSRISVVQEIMDALMVADINRIGVHGMGGVGKTTMVKQVAQQAMEKKWFDEVVMATVTQTPDVQKIQGQLADMLGLKFEEEGEWGRASRLRQRLKLKEKVLVILDDLWETIDLDAVGIPSKDELKGCKILLTSRDKDILSREMGCQKSFGVGCLTEDEAWNLFKCMAGDTFDPEVQSVAVDVAKQCERLPVAIVTVARALNNKELSAWENALQDLSRSSTENFTGGVPKGTYSCIEFSYNHIDSKELKSLFLLCSLIMGYNASTHNLLKYVMGLRLFPDVFRISEARNKMDTLLGRLKDSCLLLDNDSNEQFAMHDLVRDVAVSIASRDHQVFVANSEDELDLLNKGKQNQATQIWSRCFAVELLKDLECPELELFQIFNGDPDPQMLGDIFEGMHKLKVLNLTNFSFSMLPQSLHLLKNLQTLCLDQSVLGDITIIGELKNLEILSFVKCSFKQLPREISHLTKLKSLDLTDCSELEVIPQNVISKLSRLEELYMGNSFHQWQRDGSNNASISELENLTHLSSLDIHIRDPRVMSKDMFSKRLQRYRILIGDVWDWDGVYKTLRTLKLKLDASTNALESGVQMLLKKSEDLYLLELHGVKNIIFELDREGFPKLKHLHLHNSPEIQYIIDTTEGVQSNPFPMLESLILDNLESLEKIYHGAPKAQSPFRKLKALEVENCHKLKNLMSFSVAQCLQQLQNLKLSFCTNMEEIFVEEEEEYFDVKNEAINVMEFAQLRSVSLQHLPCLRNFCSGWKGSCLSQTHSNSLATNMGSGEIISEDALRSPAPLFSGKIVFPTLVDLELYSINIEVLWLPGIAFPMQNLQRLTVDGCSGLKYIFSAAMVKSLLRLKHLLVRDCDSVEEIIHTDILNEEETMSEMSFPQLDNIELIDLRKLKRFCAGYPINCPMLKQLIIEKCWELQTFVSNVGSSNMTVPNEAHDVNCEENRPNATQPLFDEKVAFPSLATIKITWVDDLEKIWHNLLAEDSFCKLRSLKVSHCDKLVNVFPPNLLGRFRRLELLDIRNCYLLEEIFEFQELSVEETRLSNYAFEVRYLELSGLTNLKNVWNKDPRGICNFRNLKIVGVCFCDAIKNLFPFSVAMDLPQLEELVILSCSVEEIVEKAEKGHEDPSFVFPRLENLRLNRLREFRNFYSAKHTWQCPKLKCLGVVDCGNVKVFGSKFLKFDKIHGEFKLKDTIQEPLFYVEKVSSNLEQLSLCGKDSTTSIIWSCQIPAKFYAKVIFLGLSEFTGISDPVPFGFLRKLQNLESLSISSSSLKNLFLQERTVDEEENLEMLPKFGNLSIRNATDARHLWEQDHHMVPLLQNLENLNVYECDGLFSLASSSASFQNLTTLSVCACPRLMHLIMPSTARSLRKLKNLSLSYCKTMTEIVGKQEDVIEDEIVFRELEYLELIALENLTSFCSGSYTFEFPSLKEMVVEKCAKMMIFSPGVLSAPKLLGVFWEREPKKKAPWQGNLNATIRQMCIEMVAWDINRASWTGISFSDFPHLEETWHLQPPFKVLNNLVSLTVDKCSSLSVAIPSNVLRALNNLKYLVVSKCDSLEVGLDLAGLNAEEGQVCLLPCLEKLSMMDLPRLQRIWNRNPRGILDFPKFMTLEVSNCGSLRSVFTPSITLGLVQFQRINIENCATMEAVIAEETSEEVATTDKIIFPVLSAISFFNLPNLTCIYPGNRIVEFPSLEVLKVNYCPKMKAFIRSFLREPEPNSVNEEIEQGLGHDIPIAPRFNFNYEVAISNLKVLGAVDWNDIMEEICHSRFRADLFCKLTSLTVAHFPQECVVFPSRLLGRFTSLEELVLGNASFEVIVQHEDTNGDQEYHDGVLPRLKILDLIALPKLVHLSKEEESLPCMAFRNLEFLRVTLCGSLKILSPSSVSFQCLAILEIINCHGLIKLMTTSTAKSLVKLVGLTVSDCELIQEIVADKDNEVENEVIFPELIELKFVRLPSLTSFYSGNGAFKFPSLTIVEVENCHKMHTFCQGDKSILHIYRISLSVDGKQWKRDSDLNTGIQKMCSTGDGEEQSELPSSEQTTLVNESTHAGKTELHVVSEEGLASDDLHVTGNPDTSEDVLPVPEPTVETKDNGSNGLLKETKVTQLESRRQGFREPSDDKKDHGQSQASPTPVDIVETCISPRIQTGPQTTDKGKVPQDQVVHASSSIYQSVEVPECLATDDKQPPKLVSASSTKTSTYEPLTSVTASNFESLVSSVEQLLNPNQASSAQSTLNSTLACETNQADGNVPTGVCERQASEDLHVSGTSQTSKDLPPVVETILKPNEDRLKGVLREPEIALLAQDFHAPSPDKDQPLQDNVIPTISLRQSNAVVITSEDFLATGTSETSKDLSPVIETVLKPKENRSKGVLRELEITTLAQDLGAASHEKDEPQQVSMSTTASPIKIVYSQELFFGTASESASGSLSSMQEGPARAQNSPTPMDETPISLQVPKFPSETEKDGPSQDNVIIPAISFQQSNTIPISSSTSGEQVPVSTSASPTDTSTSQELKFSHTSHAASMIPAILITEMSSHSIAANFGSLFASMEKLINSSPAASSALASSSDTQAESRESSGVSFESYIYSLALVKKLLIKSPAEVDKSVDRLLLLSSLKNLKNCPFLNSQQQEIIQVYIKNFNTLVSSQPFDEKKPDWTSSIKFSIENGKHSIAELKISYEDLTSKASRLNAEQEALMKRLHEIEEEKDHIRVNTEGLHAELVSMKGKLETHMNALVEAEKQQREAENKASYVDDYWAKFRSLFA